MECRRSVSALLVALAARHRVRGAHVRHRAQGHVRTGVERKEMRGRRAKTHLFRNVVEIWSKFRRNLIFPSVFVFRLVFRLVFRRIVVRSVVEAAKAGRDVRLEAFERTTFKRLDV